jgi:hypothetical protein
MRRIAVISRAESDISRVLEHSGHEVRLIHPDEVTSYDLDQDEAIAILGGVSPEPVLFRAPARAVVDRQIDAGKRVFCEYVSSISDIYFTGPDQVRRKRLVYSAGALSTAGLPDGALLDAQSNQFLPPFRANGTSGPILLYAATPPAHDVATLTEEAKRAVSSWALWLDKPNLLVSTIRLCTFAAGRFAPVASWQAVIALVLRWLLGAGEDLRLDCLERPAVFHSANEGEPLEARARQSVRRATRWFERSGMVLSNGKAGVKEGVGGTVHPDGRQDILPSIRTDCCSEAGMLYFLHHLLTGDPRSLTTSDNLHAFCMDNFQVRDGGPFHGMLRWGEGGWPVCYQDDNARVLIPVLLKNLYGRKGYLLRECVEALEFLVRTTGTDGTRVQRTDMNLLTAEGLAALGAAPGKFPSAHYNAFYLGALALCARVLRNMGSDAPWAAKFAATATEVSAKGLGSIMAVYPNTIREHSETQELCRLVAPLAWLMWATGKQEHRDWLYRVAKDLERLRHSSGGYAEWDTGYTATCARNENGECSLLANNGDPVADLLYSLNWLPLGFMQAYFVTRDPHFLRLWEDIARFMVSVQLSSRDPLLDGGWARALDMGRMEVFAVPFDVGWGPWSIESGWTVAEIGAGLAMGVMKDRLSGFYR